MRRRWSCRTRNGMTAFRVLAEEEEMREEPWKGEAVSESGMRRDGRKGWREQKGR